MPAEETGDLSDVESGWRSVDSWNKVNTGAEEG